MGTDKIKAEHAHQVGKEKPCKETATVSQFSNYKDRVNILKNYKKLKVQLCFDILQRNC